MRLSGQTVTLILTDEGKQVLILASVNLPQASLVTVTIEESEDMGLWIRVPREDQVHFFLIRWEYIVGIDIQSGMGRSLGLRA